MSSDSNMTMQVREVSSVILWEKERVYTHWHTDGQTHTHWSNSWLATLTNYWPDWESEAEVARHEREEPCQRDCYHPKTALSVVHDHTTQEPVRTERTLLEATVQVWHYTPYHTTPHHTTPHILAEGCSGPDWGTAVKNTDPVPPLEEGDSQSS